MKRGWMKRVGWIVAVGALVVVAWPERGSATVQQQDDAECRCVDASGDPIEDCTCFRLPPFEMAFAPFSARPRLGISVSTDQAASLDAEGARVTSVLEDGPAEVAGLQLGDVITGNDGRSLLEPLEPEVEEELDLDESLPVQRLLSIARGLEAGQAVAIEYLRDGQRLTTTAEARELTAGSYAYAYGIEADRMRADAERVREQVREMRDGMRDLEFRFDDPSGAGVRFFGGGDAPWVIGPLGSSRYGIQLVELNEGLGSYFGVTQGVLVTEVDEDSTLGLRPGDVILRIGEREVTTPDRALQLLATYAADEDINFRVRRNGVETNVLGRIG